MLRTKLNRPRLTTELVYRDRLIDQLNQNTHKPLTLVSAGAGYGKSTLVSSWLEKSAYKYIWYSMDEDDNDLQEFLKNLSEAIDTLQPGASSNFRSLISGPNLPPTKDIAHSLINELDLLEDDFVLVLDDFHVIKNQELIEIFNTILQFPPEVLHLVIITRIDPPLKINSLRAHSRLNEIRMADLSFSENEIVALINETHSEVIKKETIIGIKEATEGWVTAIKLIGLAVDEFDKGDDLIPNLKKKSHFVKDFLFDEVFKNQSDDIKKLLVVSSLFEQFTAEFLDSLFDEPVKGRTTGEDFIEHLNKFNLFIISIDVDGKWYRLHHLFRDLLRPLAKKELVIDQLHEYHRRASRWFLKEGLIDNAIKYAITGNDIGAALAIIEMYRNEELEGDRRSNLERWINNIPSQVQESNALIQLTKAWIYYQQTRLGPMIEIIGHIDSNFIIEELPKELQGELELLKGVLAYFSGESERSRDLLKSASRKLYEEIGVRLGEAELLYALSLQMCGDKETGIKVLEQGMARAKPTDLMYLTRMLTGLNFVYVLAADFVNARIWSEPMKKIVHASGSKFALVWVEYLVAFVEYNCFNLEGALFEFKSAIKRKFFSDISLSVSARIGEVMCLQMMKNPDAAQSKLNELISFVETIEHPDYLATVSSFKARLALANGDFATAMRWAKTSSITINPLAIFVWVEVPAITKSRVLIKSTEKSDIEDAVKILNEVDVAVKAANFECHNVDILILLSIAFHRLDMPAKSTTALRDAINIARPMHWIRPFVEVGYDLHDLLKGFISDGNHDDFVAELIKIIEDLVTQTQNTEIKRPTTPSTGLNKLTTREIETIEWLSKGLRNKEIADKMFVTVDAVKKHLYRIFFKMDVKSRIELVNKAKDHNLLNSES